VKKNRRQEAEGRICRFEAIFKTSCDLRNNLELVENNPKSY
jgi:hypothetical protein